MGSVRIGLFGGTFNPIHNGHLYMAKGVKEEFALDHIHLILSALPPHKTTQKLASNQDRLRMLRLAAASETDMVVSEIELKRKGPSFTIDTVEQLKETLVQDTELFLILGMDAFRKIGTWKSFKALFAQIALIVLPRPTVTSAAHTDNWATVKQFLTSNISDRYNGVEGAKQLRHPHLESVYVSDLPTMDLAATDIRERVKQNLSISGLVPETVENYIIQNGLYRW